MGPKESKTYFVDEESGSIQEIVAWDQYPDSAVICKDGVCFPKEMIEEYGDLDALITTHKVQDKLRNGNSG